VDGIGDANVSELESELRFRLALVVAGSQALRDFQAWFVPVFWDEEGLDDSTRRLAHEAELVIAEYTSGAWTVDDARRLLRGLISTPVTEAEWGGGFPRVVTGTTSRLIRRSRVPDGAEAVDLQPADIRFAAVSG